MIFETSRERAAYDQGAASARAEVERLTKEVNELRRIQPELEAQAMVKGHRDGVAEVRRRLASLNIRVVINGE